MRNNIEKEKHNFIGKWMLFGMTIGIGIGTASGNAAVGIPMGMAIGVAIGTLKWKAALKKKQNDL